MPGQRQSLGLGIEKPFPCPLPPRGLILDRTMAAKDRVKAVPPTTSNTSRFQVKREAIPLATTAAINEHCESTGSITVGGHSAIDRAPDHLEFLIDTQVEVSAARVAEQTVKGSARGIERRRDIEYVVDARP